MQMTNKSALTPRQDAIIKLLKERHSNKSIARQLGISHYTVRNHITLLRRILNVERRHELAKRAIEMGLIDATNPIDEGTRHD